MLGPSRANFAVLLRVSTEPKKFIAFGEILFLFAGFFADHYPTGILRNRPLYAILYERRGVGIFAKIIVPQEDFTGKDCWILQKWGTVEPEELQGLLK
jgi:hypothetical protein